MKLLAMLTMSAAVLASTTVFTNAFAQDDPRTDAGPTSQEQVAPDNDNVQRSGGGEGPGMPGVSQSGRRTMTPNDTSSNQKPCVGPVSYCTLYFGS
jgi:hypothetical protein